MRLRSYEEGHIAWTKIIRRLWGRSRMVGLRTVMDALLYLVSTDCQWRAMLKISPPRSTVFTVNSANGSNKPL